MTRKDYIAIAAAIRATQERIRAHLMCEQDRIQQLRGVRRAAAHISDALQADNPKGFDAQLFLINCGYGAGPPAYRPRDMDDAGQPVGLPRDGMYGAPYLEDLD